MKSAVPILAGLLAVSGCDRGAQPPRTEAPCLVMAWVRLPAIPGRPGAAYFVLRSGARETRLVGLSSPQAGRAEMHGPGMRALGPQPLAPGGELEFAPGGRHVMLYDLDARVQPTGRLSLTFDFDSGPDLTATVPAVPASFPDRPEGAVQSEPRRC